MTDLTQTNDLPADAPACPLTSEVNQPKFSGWGDLGRSFRRVSGIYWTRKLDGGPVLRPWVDNRGWLTPAFREKICLVVTLTNHCVG